MIDTTELVQWLRVYIEELDELPGYEAESLRVRQAITVIEDAAQREARYREALEREISAMRQAWITDDNPRFEEAVARARAALREEG